MGKTEKPSKKSVSKSNGIFHKILILPLFPFLITFWLVLARYNRNVDQLALHFIWPALVTSLLLVGLVFLILRWRKASQTAYIFFGWTVFIFFMFGDISSLMSGLANKWTWLHFLSNNITVLVLLALCSLFLYLLLNNKNIQYERLYSIINFILLVLIGFNLAGPIKRQFQQQASIESNNEVLEQPIDQNKSSGRDVYYLVFDRYASSETLERLYGYDNSEFLNFLKSRGFIINEDAYANYQFTTQSLSSTLNLRYFDQEQAAYKDTDKNLDPYYDLLNHNTVGKFVKKFGYKYFHIGSWWEPTKASSEATASFARGSYLTVLNRDFYPNEFTQLILQNTLLKPLLARPIKVGNYTITELVVDISKVHVSNFSYQLKTLKKIEKTRQKKYVFVHFLMPHPPFVFSSSGQVYFKKGLSEVDKKAYLEQLKYTNSEIEKMVTDIQNLRGQQPIIVIQADEGPYPASFYKFHKDDNDNKYSWPQASSDDLQEKFGILSAYYLPGNPKQQPYNGITGVNTFRLVFNNYFGTNLPLLPDRSFVYERNGRYYNYSEITDKLPD